MTKPLSSKNIVLYADDDLDDLQLVQDAFTAYSNNVEVLTFTDGLKILHHLENSGSTQPKPCLIILDINMPRLTGKEVLIEIRNSKEYKDVPVVLFSTSSLQQEKEFARTLNAGFITKPIDLRHMEIIAAEFIEHCSQDIQKQIRKELK